MRYAFIFVAATALIIQSSQARQTPSRFAFENELVSDSGDFPPLDSSIADRAPGILSETGQLHQVFADAESPAVLDSAAAPKQRLMPANLSIMEKALWGEDGIVRSIGLEPPLTPDERRSELHLRRTMLTTHQIGGFVTLGLMIGAVYFGQQIIDGHPEYRRNHQYFVTATIISYSATGLLAILSPPPMIRRNEVSTTTIHKTLAWIHVAGMIITPILGGMIKRRSSSAQESEHIHQISGYLTTATFAASMVVVTF